MRYVFVFFVALLAMFVEPFSSCFAQNDIIKRDKGSITFWVDGELPNPKLYNTISGEIRSFPVESDETSQFVFRSSSLASDSIIYLRQVDGRSFSDGTPFFNGMVSAFAYHNPVVLSPDILWLLVSQGFSHYVNENSEMMRKLFVDFEGRKSLIVRTDKNVFSPDFDWDAVTADFVRQTRFNLKDKGVADMVLADFSTSGQKEIIASRITLMNTVGNFFEYTLMETICGIPYITLQGTPDDWKKFASKVESLRKYGLGWWADELKPITAELIRTSQGNPDREFWKNIVKKTRPGEVRGLGCLPLGGETMFDGWFLKLMPFTEDGRTPDEVSMAADMLAEISETHFDYQMADDNGNVLGTIPMRFQGGILGCMQDRETKAISFKTGWMVSYNEDALDKEAQFPGGEESMHRYFKENLHITSDMLLNDNGRRPLICTVMFLIGPDGSILEREIWDLDNRSQAAHEVLKVMDKMPKWEPATYKGIPVVNLAGSRIQIDVE